ncbi:MAG: hypothetical protein PWQ94_349 [Thermoanaerobacterium sp.]|nr:hypothetical protein [Thermoanaerobacterium sp.]
MLDMAFLKCGTLRETLQKIRGNANLGKDIINLILAVVTVVGLYIIVNAPKSIIIKIEFKSLKIEINTKKE